MARTKPGATDQRRQRLAYANGFLLSVLLTVAAYLLVTQHTLTNHIVIGAIVTLALLQFAVQLLFFLHLGAESRPRWRLVVFAFMLMVVAILVFGSLWIMNNLNYHMTPQQLNNYLHNQDGI